MYGILFRTNRADNILKTIFNNVNLRKFEWYNIPEQTESYEIPMHTTLLSQRCYSGSDFSKCIAKKHFIVFLKMQAYLETENFKEIIALDDFNKSKCRLILLIYDCEYVEVYAKDKNIIQSVYSNAIKNNFSDIKLLKDSGITRKTFCIL